MLPRLVTEAARRFGEQPAFASVAYPGRAVSYAELDRLSDEVAVGLARRGVRAGDHVALILPPCVEYPVLYVAAAKLGAVTAGLNTRLPEPQQRRLLDLVSPRLVVAESEGHGGAFPTTVVSTIHGPLLGELRVPDEAPGALAEDAERPVAIVFTSGTTGVPKAAVFANRQLEAVTRIDVGDAWGGGGPSVAATSLAHLGPMTKLPGSLRRGGTMHLTPRWKADEALELTSRLGVGSIGGIPTQVALMLASPRFAETDLSSVRLVVIGGAPATAGLVRAAREGFDAPVSTRYSCTEAGIGCGTRPDDPPEDAEETVGRPQPGVELAIRDPDGRPAPTGEVGEVLLRSPAAMAGYLRDPEATAAVFTTDGYVRTGDLGRIDDRGRLRLAGRRKEMYIRGGYNVYPMEVEAALSTCPGVRAVAVVPVPDEVMGEVGVAAVVTEPGAQVSLNDLRAHGEAALPWYGLPERLVLVEALPLTPGDKVDRAALRELVDASGKLTVTSSKGRSRP